MSTRRPASIPGRSRWSAYWTESVKAIDKPTPTELRLLERLILNFIAADQALKRASAEPVIEGSRGQPAAHPGFGIAERCDKTALSIARELGLTTTERTDGDEDEGPEDDLDALDAEAEDELAEARSRRTQTA